MFLNYKNPQTKNFCITKSIRGKKMIQEEIHWKTQLKNLVGFSLMIIGIVLIVSSATITTGNIVLQKIINKQVSTIGIILFLGGVIVLFTSNSRKDLEGKTEELDVYTTRKENPDPERDYFVTDPGYFGGSGLSLGRFKEEIARLRETDQGLVTIVREAYVPPLLRIADGDDYRARIAKMFLGSLGVSYVDDEQELSGEENDGEKLSREEREEIKSAFKNLDERKISEILERHGYDYLGRAGKHHKWEDSDGHTITLPVTPSDWRSGRNSASMIIRLLEKASRKS